VADQGPQWLSDAIVRYGIEAVVAGIVVFLLLKVFLPGYLSEKGKNLATREDFHTLLEQLKKTTKETESIKVELSSRHWLNQQQWSIREKRYTDLLSNLTRLKLSLQDRNNYYMEPGSEHDSSLSENEHFNELSRIGYESLRAIREQIGPASVFLSDKTIEALEELVREHWNAAEFSVCTADYVSSALNLVDAASSAVLAEARNELGHDKTGT
jgi:hypothetical protein